MVDETYTLAKEMPYGAGGAGHDQGQDPGGGQPLPGEYPFNYFGLYEYIFTQQSVNTPAENAHSGQFAATEIINTMMNYNISLMGSDDTDQGNDNIYMGLYLSSRINPGVVADATSSPNSDYFYETPGEINTSLNPNYLRKVLIPFQ